MGVTLNNDEKNGGTNWIEDLLRWKTMIMEPIQQNQWDKQQKITEDWNNVNYIIWWMNEQNKFQLDPVSGSQFALIFQMFTAPAMLMLLADDEWSSR